MLAPGEIVDRYVVERLVGSGGMGEVWQVRHRVLGTLRALKVLHTETPGSTALLREGQLQARVDHDNVLPVLDVLAVEEGTALVLPFVDGPSLGHLLALRRLTEAEAAGIADAIAAGLGYAHAMRVVHRDLKPGNVLLDRVGSSVVPRIADFGLAIAWSADRVSSRPGMVVGTLQYAAPEQLRALPGIDARADWWAFGVMLCEMLTGERPFDHQLGALLRGGRPPLPESVPAAWRDLLEALLRATPSERLCDAAAVRDALGARAAPSDVHPLAASTLLAGVVPGTTPADGSRATLVPATPLSARPPTAVTLATQVPQPQESSRSASSATARRQRLVGRDTEVAAVVRLLAEGRLVSITGPGGVGKSALAVVAAGEAAATPLVVDTSRCRTERDVFEGAARVLGTDTTSAAVIHALRARGPSLLVLDGAEAALRAVVPAVEALVDAAPALRVVVTSQEPLRVPGEATYALAPLALPPDGATVEVASASAAVALFLERAHAADPSFSLDPDNVGAVCALVRALDGLPLALEIAATRVRALPPGKLLDRLDRRLDLLVDRRQGSGPGRSVRAVLDAAWSRLAPWERWTLARIAAHDGPVTLEEVEHRFDLSAWGDDAPSVEEVVAELVLKSLVVVGGGDGRQLDLLHSVRAHARENGGPAASGRSKRPPHPTTG